MRLTCPNCGAQYQVPDEVIPSEGRDVQCSNCGHTWFQAHSEFDDLPPREEGATGATDEARDPGLAAEDSDQSVAPEDPEWSDWDDSDDEDLDDDLDETEEEPQPPVRQELDSAISGILREEAEREAQLRATEFGGLESQPELGLDTPPDDTARRALQARERMARIRGEDPEAVSDSAQPAPSRELLPDIEEINSTLRSSDMPADVEDKDQSGGGATPTRRSGFLRGFSVALLIGAFLALSYANAPRIARTLPQVDPALSAYVAMVDQARYWLDARLGDFVTRAFPE